MSHERTLGIAVICMAAVIFGGCHIGSRPKLFYVNSYHAGYASSDAVMAGMYEIVADSRAKLEVFFMDTKRHSKPETIATKTQEALAAIAEARPDVIVASDDNAVKFVVAEHFREGPIPCVFCGVNWTCEPYGLPTDNVTGMLEVLPVLETVEVLRQYYPDMRNLVVLSENTVSEQKNEAILASIFAKAGLTTTYKLVGTFEQWKDEFIEANQKADVVFIPTNGAVQNWNEAEAQVFVRDHIRVPVFTCDDFMMKYAVFGLTKVAQEQGRWAARTALRIARGTAPAKIPVTCNQQTMAYVNHGLAEQIGWHPDEALLSRSHRVDSP